MEVSAEKYIGMMLDDRYEILELIGSGGMANVYKALCHRLNRYDAIKIMRDDTAANEEFKKHFRDESKAVAMLSHPNIVSVYDVSHNDGIEYIVMELVDGITLKDYMRANGPLKPAQVLDFSIQISRALAHAHSKGIIHRDIKPQNVMLLDDGLIKVGDFGIAALESEIEETSDVTIGSVHYIAPEQARGLAADARSDIYSLGIVMYEMMTGQLPYNGSSELEVAVKHMNTDPVHPRAIMPGIPKELEKICLKAMATDISDRYQSAEEILAELEKISKKLHKQEPQTPVLTSDDDEYASAKHDTKKEKKQRKHALSSGIVAVLILIILVFVFITGYFLRDLFTEPIDIEVPSFVGRYYEDVINDKDYDSQYRFTVNYKVDLDNDYGIIIDQSPMEGSERTLENKDSRVDVELIISAGEALPDDVKTMVEVPDIVNKEQMTAISMIKNAGFNYAIYEAESQSITKGYVIYTEPAAGESVESGSEIKITVSAGPETEMISVPKLIGLSKSAAIDKIESSNLSVGKITKVESEFDVGTVIWQSRDAGQTVEERTQIDLQISSGMKNGD